MKNEISKSGLKIKWINYRTGISQLYIRLETDKKNARVCIDLQHKDEGIRALFFEQFLELKKVFTQNTTLNWVWEQHFINANGDEFSRIYTEIDHVNLFDKSTWKEAFNFYKKAMLDFDEFWVDYKDLFLQLQ